MALRPHIVLTLATAVAALPEAAPAADLTVVWSVTSPRGGTRTHTHSISSSRIRTSTGRRDIVVDGASGRVIQIDHRRREYWQTSLDEVAAFLRQTEKALSAGSALDKTLGRLAPVKVERGAGGRRIAGYDTEHHILAMGDAIRVEVWTAPALDPPDQVFQARRVAYATIGPLGARLDRILDEVRKLPGFPLAVTVAYRMRMGPRQIVTEAQEVREGPVPEKAFAVPDGYRKVDSPFGRGRG